MAQLFKGPELDSLRRCIIQYVVKTYKLDEKHPGIEISSLHEVNAMLSENIERWKEKCVFF